MCHSVKAAIRATAAEKQKTDTHLSNMSVDHTRVRKNSINVNAM